MIERVCRQPGCQLGTSGRCLEGFDPPEECPYQSGQSQTTEEPVAFVEQDLVGLPSGEALAERQASEVTRCGPTKLIIIAGPHGSGKTTILASLFEAFQEAPFGNYIFRGSRTLVGFEQRCHLGRRESGLEIAKTAHTSAREGVVFLHLDLAFRLEGGLSNTHLLLSDISGELFKRIRDSSDAVNDVAALGRADHVCIVIDGEKLVSGEARQLARNDSRSILRSLIESGRLWRDCVIDLVITKWDVVIEALKEDGGAGAALRSYIDETARAVREVARGREMRIHEIAARPPVNAKVPFAHGLPTLLRSWMDHERVIVHKPTVFSVGATAREFNRYTETVLARSGLVSAYDISQI
jgi:hypothetical protein